MKSSELNHSSQLNKAKIQAQEIESELVSAVNLMDEFEKTVPRGYNRFLSLYRRIILRTGDCPVDSFQPER